MDRFDTMSVLLAVVEEGSLSAGARRLRVPLATVSRKVSDLEAHLGTQLLVRTSRQVMLTDSGRSYVEAAKRILEQVEEAERSAAGEHSEPRGQLSITTPVVFGRLHVLPIAADFLNAHPNINLRMYMIDRYVNLLEENLDVGVRLGHLQDSALRATRVGQVRRVICASPAYIARCGIPKVPDDLRQHQGISFQGFATSPEWRYRGDNETLAVEARNRVVVNTTEAAVDAALAGLGIVRLLSYQVIEKIQSGELVPLLEEFAPDPIPVQLIYAEQGMLPVKVRAFLDWITPRLRSRLAELGLD